MISDDLILNFTPTGMIPTKHHTQFVPISISEIIEDVHHAVEVGISMVHIHARDENNGLPTYKKETYAKIIEGIRQFSKDLVICVSLSGRTFKTFEERSDVLNLTGDLKPDMGSLTLSSLNFNKIESVNSPEMIGKLALAMKNYAKYLFKKELIAPPYYFNLLFGNIACAQADLLHVGVMINDLPENSIWSLAGIGDMQLKMNSLSIAMGGGVRVGLEDNIWFDKGRTKLAANIDLLKRIHHISEANERQVMSSENLRKRLNLEDGRGKYGIKCL